MGGMLKTKMIFYKPHATFLHTQVKFQTFWVNPVVVGEVENEEKIRKNTGKKLNFIKDFGVKIRIFKV